MPRKTMSDLIRIAEEKGINMQEFYSNKEEDLKNLAKSGLPTNENFYLKPEEFLRENQRLQDYFERHLKEKSLFCVRVLPTEQGLKKGYTRKPRLGIRYFAEAKKHVVDTITQGEEDLWTIAITPMSFEELYGGVFAIGERYIQAEIGKSLEQLTSGEIDPLVSLIIDTTQPPGERINICKNESKPAETFLIEAISIAISRNLKGYFEFVIQKKIKNEIIFVDYKDKKTALGYVRKL